MTKRRVLRFLVLLTSCVLTSLVTKWVVLADVERDCGDVPEFPRYKAALNEFVCKLGNSPDGEQVNGEQLPANLLRELDIVNVYRNGRFIYFCVSPHLAFWQTTQRLVSSSIS